MKLALKELKYYKFKYAMITAILFLLAFLVLFVSSLAQGLAKDNISFIEHLDSSHYVINQEADHSLTASSLSDHDTHLLTSRHIPLLTMQMVAFESNKSVAAVYMKGANPQLIAGRLPVNEDEIAIDESLKQDFKLNDTMKVKNKEVHFKITGFVKDNMYAHTAVGYMTAPGLKRINPDIKPNVAILKSPQISGLKEAEVITDQELKKGIASYEAEQLPLNLMIIFLFVISAIVIAAFFYVITIQKTTEYGILKAIGFKNKKIAVMILIEIMIITSIGVLTAIALTYLIAAQLPVTMPFHINNQLILILVMLFFIVGLAGALLSLIKVIRIDPQLALGGE
ncbi:ABC transporter permease [Macrococcus hajekii]|uniref:Putative hemin transport system permease protein HrtB n=1 Tax=Macrococcus hajekii TaxID=198482 RepID=A0A4R6BN06_9STAP|nr:ABC transporter permease [Macrococcus hajekii]TDM03234.1 ABC transporter permease [Macrococcus hajekii]GGA97181.1 putative hemin transport system permease protein HrtB [Macrococcus hajekii]